MCRITSDAKHEDSEQRELRRERDIRTKSTMQVLKLRVWGDSTSVRRLRFGRPVRVVVTTLRLVGEAEIQLRRHSLHLVLLELESSDSVQSLRWVFKVDSRNLYRLRSLQEFTIASWILRTTTSTPAGRSQSSRVKSFRSLEPCSSELLN